MKRSPLDLPDFAPESTRFTSRLVTSICKLGALLPRAWMGEGDVHDEPVSPAALELGRFVAIYTDLTRVRQVNIDTASYNHSTADPHHAIDIQEYHGSERREKYYQDRPNPTTVLKLYGVNYRRFDPRDNGVCKFGVYQLMSGDRLIQAAPYEFASVSGGDEDRAWHNTLDELFGDDRATIDELTRHEYARTNLGVMDAAGKIAMLRTFNPQPFGCHILPILNRVSGPEQLVDMSIQVYDGFVEEYT